MKLVQVVKAVVLAGAMAVIPTVASASVTVSYEVPGNIWGGNGHRTATITSPISLGTQAGSFALKGDLDGVGPVENFTAWCLDIVTFIALPSAYNIVTNPFVASGFDITSRISTIENLFETSLVDLSDNDESAGFQLALWELAYETSSTFDVGVGSFKATSTSGAVSFANDILDGLGGALLQNYDLTFLESVTHSSQNLVTAKLDPGGFLPPVPLPGAGLLLLGALGGLGMLGRRRRHQSA